MVIRKFMNLLNKSDYMKKLQQLPLEFLKCNRSSYQANPFLPTPIAVVGHDRNVFLQLFFFCCEIGLCTVLEICPA